MITITPNGSILENGKTVVDATAPTIVVTYQAPNGATKNICEACGKKLAAIWPRNVSGEYCTASRGQHYGTCDICAPQE